MFQVFRTPDSGSRLRRLFRQHLDQAVLKLESLEVLLDTHALVASVRADIVDVAERAVDAVSRDAGVAEIEAVGRTGTHHWNDDDAGKHLFGERFHGVQ